MCCPSPIMVTSPYEWKILKSQREKNVVDVNMNAINSFPTGLASVIAPSINVVTAIECTDTIINAVLTIKSIITLWRWYTRDRILYLLPFCNWHINIIKGIYINSNVQCITFFTLMPLIPWFTAVTGACLYVTVITVRIRTRNGTVRSIKSG